MEKSGIGILVISLDFELLWGMFDKTTVDAYGRRIRGVHKVVPKLLSLFSERNIHATWATVGMLMCENKTQLLESLPPVEKQPHYTQPEFSAYKYINRAEIKEYDQHYFAPGLVHQIITTPGQELASHTFSHFYCLEEQVGGEGSSASFAADCAAFQTIAAQYNQTPTSIIFPRNQWSIDALDVCKKNQITAFRGTEQHPIYQARDEQSKTNLLRRGLRFIDRYLNLTGHHTHTIIAGDIINIPASRQLIPHNTKLSIFDSLRLRRIKNAMTHAAKNGEVFHLWWHPHNFGSNQEENFSFLIKILDHFSQLQTQYGMESKNMNEVAIAVSARPDATT